MSRPAQPTHTLPRAYTLWDRLVHLWDRLAALVRRTASRPGARPAVESLEDRTVPSRPLPIPVIYTGYRARPASDRPGVRH